MTATVANPGSVEVTHEGLAHADLRMDGPPEWESSTVSASGLS